MPVAGLPELTLHMGGATLAIKGAALRPKTGFAPWFHVWAGADLLLLKDTDKRLDLGAMRLTYE
jgi:hypothetical protein